MFRRPHYIAFGAVLFLGLIFISLPSRTTTKIKLAVGGLFLPLFGLAGSGQPLFEQIGSSFRSKRALQSQVEQLRLENEQLRLQAAQVEQVWEENERLREAVGWQRQTKWRAKRARVIARDPANWWRTLQINLGSRDGVVTNQPVLTPDGLVGRVSEVGFSASQVVLVGDPNCRVSAVVEEAVEKTSSRKAPPVVGHGVIGSGASSILDPTIVDLTYLDRQSKLKPGQRVVTSGLGGVFPRSIPIGHIAEVTSAGYGLYQQAKVKLSADLARVEEVWVMFP